MPLSIPLPLPCALPARVLLDVPVRLTGSAPGGDVTELALIGNGGGAYLARLLVYLSEPAALHFPTRATDCDRRRFRVLVVEDTDAERAA